MSPFVVGGLQDSRQQISLAYHYTLINSSYKYTHITKIRKETIDII